MSPPPTSPTPTSHEDDECLVDVTNLAIDSVTLLICLIGLVGNGAVLWLLGFRIRGNRTIVYILNLAFASFIFLLFMGILSILYIVENVSCSTIVTLNPKIISLLSLLFYNMGLYLLTAISIEWCVSILWLLRNRGCHPQRVSVMVFASSIAVVTPVIFLCPGYEHCRIALISIYAINLIIFAPSMVISSTILLIKLLCGYQFPYPRRGYIVIFLAVLLFLLFALPLSICNFLQQFGYTTVTSQVVSLLACINSSLNPFSCFLVGSCRRQCSLVSFRNALRRVFEEQEGNRGCRNDIVMDELDPTL